MIGKSGHYLVRFSLILVLVRTAEDGETAEEVRRVDVERARTCVECFLAYDRRIYDVPRDEARDRSNYATF